MVSETVELRGHIIDSLILPKVLDEILKTGGQFKIKEITIGEKRADQSYARIEVSMPAARDLEALTLRLRQHGAEVREKANAQLARCPADGVFPTDFYVTTNQQTFVRLEGKEFEVASPMRDCGIIVDKEKGKAVTAKFFDVKKGMEAVVGQKGIRVAPVQRTSTPGDVFQFSSGRIGLDNPRSAVIREMATEFQRDHDKDGRILLVAGPAVVHSGAAGHIEKLIEHGYIDLVLGGNDLAVHDIESALYGTSSGINLGRNRKSRSGHENQMRAVNAIRCAGSIEKAVEKGLLKRGIMHACVKHKVELLLAGSVRDTGPMPGVITEALEAQRLMRDKLRGVSLALLMSTMLHSAAVRNFLPATARILVVDLNPAAVQRLTESDSFQTVGLVTDVEAFLRELTEVLAELRKGAKKSA